LVQFKEWKDGQIIHLGTPQETLSFKEIMEKVQRNEMPPIKMIPDGLNEIVSESTIKPIKKPWES
jgi:hypothetical protein